MTALVVDRRDARLTLQADSLVVTAADGRALLPVSRVERLILRSPAVIDTAVLARLWAQGAGVLVLSGRRSEPTACFYGRPHNDVRRRLAQYALQRADDARLRLARALVAAKLAAQGRTLARLAEARPGARLAIERGRRRIADLGPALAAAPSVDAARGLEGAAASAYWPAFAAAFAPSLGCSGRNRRPPRDPVNAVLSLAYTLAAFEAGRRAQIAGLDPMLGALHAPAFGRDSLACDLVEPLRPRIDLWTWELFRARTLRPEHFSIDADGRCLLGKAGRGAFYEAFEARMPLWGRFLGRAARAFAAGLDGVEAPLSLAFAAPEDEP
jgi:CRISPR-associated protein Cas1